MPRKTTQREMVEHLLRANGSRGVHTFELRQAFIANPSERIAELERDNWSIQHSREKLHGSAMGSRYVLLDEPDAVSHGVPSTHVDADETAPSLFSVPVGRPERQHWQEDAA